MLEDDENNEVYHLGYHIPKIEDFKIGFEYEVYIAGSGDDYEKKVFSLDQGLFIHNIYKNNLTLGWLRAKDRVEMTCEEDDARNNAASDYITNSKKTLKLNETHDRLSVMILIGSCELSAFKAGIRWARKNKELW